MTNDHETKPYTLGRHTLEATDQTWAEMKRTEPGQELTPRTGLG